MIRNSRLSRVVTAGLPLVVLGLSTLGLAAQVVVLRHGGVLKGQVDHARDRLVVTQSSEHVVHVPLKEVDFVAQDLQAAYRKQLGRLDATDSQAHFRLAQWCLRHGLHRQAADRLLDLSRRDPEHPAVRVLETRLRKLAEGSGELPETAGARSPTASSRERHPVKEPVAIERFSEEMMAGFTRGVQPLLLNRCGQPTCHGSATTSSFQVRRGPNGVETQPLTWRNLKSTLLQLKTQDPDKSPLLLMARSLHASTQRPPFEPHELRQYQLLDDWVHAVTSGSAESKPKMTSRGVRSREVTEVASSDPTHESEGAASPGIQDPFDPGDFNARFASPAAPVAVADP